MNKNVITEATIGQINRGEFFIGQYSVLEKNNCTCEMDKWVNHFSSVSSSTKEEKAFKAVGKRMDTVSIPAVEYKIDTIVSNVGEEIKAVKPEYSIQVLQKSTVCRKENTKLKGILNAPLASDLMLGTGDNFLELFAISFDSELMQKPEGSKERTLFHSLSNGIKKGVFVSFNRNNGRYKIVAAPVANCFEFTVKYEFIGATNSGLRGGSVLFAATELHKDGAVENTDRRYELIESVIGKGFREALFNKDGSLKMITEDQLFKVMSRMMLGTPASKVIAKAENIIVFKKLGEKVEINGETMEDAFDGTSITSSSAISKYGAFPGVSKNTLRRKLLQVRAENGGIKASTIVKSQWFVSAVAKELINAGNAVEYVILDGKRMTIDKLSVEDMERLLSHLDLIIDTNALKMETFTGLEITMLKQAYASKSKINMVVNLQMMSVDPVRAIALIDKKIREDIIKKIKGLGLVPEVAENGSLKSVSVAETMTGTGQFVSSLYGMDVKKMMQLFPGAVKSLFGTTIKSVSNVINELNPEIDSAYLAVIPDIAVLFGERILNFDKDGAKEIYSASLDDNIEVSATRHPISGLNAVTTFKSLSMKEVAIRIAKSKMTKEQKKIVMEFYRFQDGYATIPASPYLNQKHDGMDFDIDAMVFISDKDVVNILREVPECGTVIGEDPLRKTMPEAELSIKSFHEKNKSTERIVRYSAEEKPVVRKAKRTSNYANLVEKRENKVVGSFDAFFNLTFKFFNSNVDPVGKIATAFYNNALLLLTLKDPSVDAKTKAKIAKAFTGYYNMTCCGDKYERKLIENKEKEIELTKELCLNIVADFVDSDGSVESVINFLEDCCAANRYPAETSIDAVKNMFQVINYFNHGKCLKAMGSDKAVTVKLVDFDDYSLYSEAITGEESPNYFDINKIDYTTDKRGYVVADVNNVDCSIRDFLKGNRDHKSVGVKDSMYKLKEELVDFANDTFVFLAETIKSEILSEEGCAYRDAVILRGADREAGDKYRNANKVCKAISRLTTTMFSSFEEKKDVDGLDARLYVKRVAEKRLVNTKDVAFKAGSNPMTDEEIGLAFVYATLSTGNVNEKPGFLHTKTMEIFGKEIIAFLKSEGINTRIEDKIISVSNGDIKVNTKELEGKTVHVENGISVLEDGTKIIFNNKKLTIEGVISKGSISYELETKEGDKDLGIYISGIADKGMLSSVKLATAYIEKSKTILIKKDTKMDICSYYSAADKTFKGSVQKDMLVKKGSLVIEFTSKQGNVVHMLAGKTINTVSIAVSNLIAEDTDMQSSLSIYENNGVRDGLLLVSCNSDAIKETIENANTVTAEASTVIDVAVVTEDEPFDMFDSLLTSKDNSEKEVSENNTEDSLFPTMEESLDLGSFTAC